MAAQVENNVEWLQNLQTQNEDKNPDLNKTIAFISLEIAELGYKCQKVDDVKTCADIIDEIASLIQNGGEVVENAASNATNLQDLIDKIRVDAMKNQCSDAVKPLMRNSEISQTVRDNVARKLEEAKVKAASDVIKNGAIASAFIVAVQVVKVYKTWQDVAKAENVVAESRETFSEIENNISEMTRSTAELSDKMAAYSRTGDEREKLEIARNVFHQTNSVGVIYIDTKDLINGIKVQISGQIERINVCAEDQAMDGISNTVQGIANLVQYCRLGDMMTSNLKLVQAAVTAAFFGLAAANAANYVISHQTLKELRATMRPLRAFDGILRNLRITIIHANKWYIDHSEGGNATV